MRTSVPLAIAVIAALALAGCKKEEEAAAPPRPVLSQVVTPTALPGTRFAGTVQAKVQAALGSRVAGRLVSRSVNVGDLVKKGDVLAVLDATAYELAVRSARAELSSAEATLASTIATEERQKTLLQSNAAAKAAVESAEQSREAADAGLVRARTALVKAEEQLSYTSIQAEFDGVVVATGAEVGQTVSPGEAIVTIARPDERDAVDHCRRQPLHGVVADQSGRHRAGRGARSRTLGRCHDAHAPGQDCAGSPAEHGAARHDHHR